MADTNSDRGDGRSATAESEARSVARASWHSIPNHTHWSDHEWIICHDGKARRTQSWSRHVADGVSDGMDRISRDRALPEETAEALQSVMSPHLLVPSFKGRTPLWKITGNAINPVLAAQVIAALMDALDMKGLPA
jgi:hypothetical protein